MCFLSTQGTLFLLLCLFVCFFKLDSGISSTNDAAADVSQEILYFFLSTGLSSDLGLHSYGAKGTGHSPPSPQPTSLLSLQPAPVSLGLGALTVNPHSTAAH